MVPRRKCPACKGKGYVPGTTDVPGFGATPERCPVCGGARGPQVGWQSWQLEPISVDWAALALLILVMASLAIFLALWPRVNAH
jgi:hypothetical protein